MTVLERAGVLATNLDTIISFLAKLGFWCSGQSGFKVSQAMELPLISQNYFRVLVHVTAVLQIEVASPQATALPTASHKVFTCTLALGGTKKWIQKSHFISLRGQDVLGAELQIAAQNPETNPSPKFGVWIRVKILLQIIGTSYRIWIQIRVQLPTQGVQI